MDLRPLRVVAHTPAGFSSGDPWSPSLDGILAFYLMRERLGEEQFALNSSNPATLTPVEGLPLGREEWRALWWWQCSAPRYESLEEYRRHYHRRFDLALAMRYLPSETRGPVRVTAGPYKNYRNVRDVHIAPRVEWHVVGDEAEIRRLLLYPSGEPRCSHIGAGSAQGLGRVTRWEIIADGDERLARFERPLPVEFAVINGLGGPCLEWGIRPPAWVPGNKVLCVMPSSEKPPFGGDGD